jgi:predicted DsbA family dithiol-disulfide isomerase
VWCFLASVRLRRIVKDYDGQVQVEHRCFALAPDPTQITRMFGSPEAGKAEIMSHWEAAASHPDGEAINTELMRSRPFPYPHSMPGLLACKAAELQGGPAAHWDMFDRVQHAHAVEARNIADPEVLRACAGEAGLELARWERGFDSPETRQAVEQDLAEAHTRGVHAVPTLLFNDRWSISGAVPEAMLRRIIDDILAGRDPTRPA